MKPRHAAALALVGWYLMMPDSSLAVTAKSKLLTYTNKAYGFSFRYPRDCTLKEGEQVRLSWGFAGAVKDSLPHGVTVASVELPYDRYRRTDFGGAFLKVSVDTSLTATECNRSSFRQAQKIWFKPARIGDNQFAEADEDDASTGQQYFAHYYHIFTNQTCYEFQLGLATSGWGIIEGVTKVDDDAVFRRLKAILATVTIHPTTVATLRLKEK
jgi:hypothetical protein